MEAASELDQGMKVLDSCLANINWRLKPSSKRRLQLGYFSLSLSLNFFLSFFYHSFISWCVLRCSRSHYKNESGCNGRLRWNHASAPAPPLFPPPTRTKGFPLYFRAHTSYGYTRHDLLNTHNRNCALCQIKLQLSTTSVALC